VSLVCPACGTEHAEDERFCGRCGVPLVVEGGPQEAVTDERHERMRKVKPQYSEGELVRVVGARHLAEAEFIQNLLLEEGVPSMVRRARGFDVPEMLAAGQRDVLVPQSGLGTAREVLLQAEILSGEPARPLVSPVRLLFWLVAATLAAGLIATLLLTI
jgi:hypothetical protein